MGNRADERAAASWAKISWSEDPVEAVRGAGCVYTDTWGSMGQEDERELRKGIFQSYQRNAELLGRSDGAYAMHCLPAHRGEEISALLMDAPDTVIWDEAENRLHAQKALMETLLLANRT